MKAIIIAAGLGSRLGSLTKDKPKCMLEIDGKTILQRSIENFKKFGIEEIIVIRGYKKELIDYAGIRYYYNDNFKNNNNLESLFYAEQEMNNDFIICFSDVVYEGNVLEVLLKDKSDISLVIDTAWTSKYENRTLHPISQADKVIIENEKIVKIGKKVNSEKAHGEFIGMAKYTSKGAEILKKTFHRAKKNYDNCPFHEAPSFEKGHIMDITQEMIDNGYPVNPVAIVSGWAEIDTPEDLKHIKNNI